MRAFFFLMLLCAVSLSEAQTTAADTTYRILTYGLPRFEYQNATWVVGQEWGIVHYPVAGCVVTQELMDSVKLENDRVLGRIIEHYGPDWRERFDADVEEEYGREVEIVLKVRELPYIQARQAEMKAAGNGLHFWVTPGPEGDEVAVHGYAPWEGSTEWLLLYIFEVEGESGAIRLVSDTPQNE